MTVQLYVSGGNRHLPDGEQTLMLWLWANEATNTPSIFGMTLTTDGRGWGLSEGWPENPTLEDKLHLVTISMMSSIAGSGLVIDRTYAFLTALDRDRFSFTEEEMIEGARRFLGVEDFSPTDYAFFGERYHGSFLDAIEEGRSVIVWYEDGGYGWPGGCVGGPPFNRLILPTPSQGDVTVRVFVYANYFYLELLRMYDFSFLRLYDEDGTPYAQLLSGQPVEVELG